MKQIKLLLILCVLILLASCRTTESTNSLNITSESKDISSGKEFVSSQPILKDNVNLSMSVFKGVTSIFSEDVINSAFKLSENKITQYGVGPKESGYIITDEKCTVTVDEGMISYLSSDVKEVLPVLQVFRYNETDQMYNANQFEKDGDLNFKSHNEVLQDFYKILQAIGLKNNYLVNCYNLDSETLKEKEKVMIDKFGGNENLDGWKDCYFLYAVPKLNDKKVFTDVHGSSEKGTMITGEEIISIVTENGLQLLVVSNSINIVEELEKKEIMTENQAKEEIERQLGQLIVSEQYTIKSIALGYYPQFADTAHKEVFFYPAWKAVVLAEGDDTMRSSNDTAYSYEFSYMIDAQTGLEISEE